MTDPCASDLCALADIPDPGAREFVVEVYGERRSVFVVHRNGEVFGYLNTCPHVGAPLNWEEDRFLDMQGEEILCAMHGAHFAIDTGACLMGPCVNKSLTPFRVAVRNGRVMGEGPTEGI